MDVEQKSAPPETVANVTFAETQRERVLPVRVVSMPMSKTTIGFAYVKLDSQQADALQNRDCRFGTGFLMHLYELLIFKDVQSYHK
jgi:hypothetical protein